LSTPRPISYRREQDLMDGESAGNIEDETFSATAPPSPSKASPPIPAMQGQDGARHQDRVRHHRSPAEKHLLAGNHRGKEGFLHPVGMSGALEKARIDFIVRDFTIRP